MTGAKIEIGQRFTLLVVKERVRRDGKPGWYWRCVCDCGKEIITRKDALLRKRTRSCGCLRTERARCGVLGETDPKIVRARIERGRALGLANRLDPTNSGKLSYYKSNARTRGHVWELTDSEFTHLVTSPCHYCGALPVAKTRIDHYARRTTDKVPILFTPKATNGIDRLDNAKGYTSDNCVTSCTTCNRAKLAMGYEEFLTWVSRVYGHLHLGERNAAI